MNHVDRMAITRRLASLDPNGPDAEPALVALDEDVSFLSALAEDLRKKIQGARSGARMHAAANPAAPEAPAAAAPPASPPMPGTTPPA